MAKKYLILAFALMVGVQLLFPLKMIIEREIIITKGQTFLFKYVLLILMMPFEVDMYLLITKKIRYIYQNL